MPPTLLVAGAVITASGVGDAALTRLASNHNETVLIRN